MIASQSSLGRGEQSMLHDKNISLRLEEFSYVELFGHIRLALFKPLNLAFVACFVLTKTVAACTADKSL